MSFKDLEQVLRDFNLGDYVLLDDHPGKLFKIFDIFDNSSRRNPNSDDYELVVVEMYTKKELCLPKEKAIKLSSDQQRLTKIIYD